MEGLAVSLTLFGVLLFGSPTDKAVLRKAHGKVGGQYVTAPAYESMHIYRQGSRWIVCGAATGHQITGRGGTERFIVDKKSLIFSGDPAFTTTPDDKDAFEGPVEDAVREGLSLGCAPPGEVVYAIGDIHGRADLLRSLLHLIEADWAQSGSPTMRLITLGDYVDRGPATRAVIDMLVGLKLKGGQRMTALRGNHEQALLDFLEHPWAGPAWVANGGRQTLASYGVAAPLEDGAVDWRGVRGAFEAALPMEHRTFLESLPTVCEIGGYVFVHAGLRPGVSLDEQTDRDRLWIRRDFLDGPPRSDRVVVHGHTPKAEPETPHGRIGIDTGAYATGILTAVRLEGWTHRFLQTGGPVLA